MNKFLKALEVIGEYTMYTLLGAVILAIIAGLMLVLLFTLSKLGFFICLCVICSAILGFLIKKEFEHN